MPPMRIGGSFRRYVVIPGTAASFGRNSLMTWSTCGRSERGFRRMFSCPWFMVLPPWPTPDIT